MTAADRLEAPRIVVGVDGSSHSKAALRWAARVAAAEHASLDVVTAWEYVPTYGLVPMPVDTCTQDELEKLAHEAVAEVLGDDPPVAVSVHTVVVEANPARALLKRSEGALMIVVGSRGHGGFAGLLLGSVSQRVTELASCPVLVVHDGNQQ